MAKRYRRLIEPLLVEVARTINAFVVRYSTTAIIDMSAALIASALLYATLDNHNQYLPGVALYFSF